MIPYAYFHGTWAPVSETSLPLNVRALYFGDGIYDAAIGTGGRIYLEDEHLDRFFSGAEALELCPSFSRQELSARLREGICRFTDGQPFFLYFSLLRTSPRRSHAFDVRTQSELLITLEDVALPDPERQVRLQPYPDLRYEYCHIKTLNLLPNVLAATSAARHGAEEAVFLRDGIVTECAHSNLFILNGRTLITHPADRHILPGVTRRHTLAAARRLGYGVEERPFGAAELSRADAVLISSTTRGLVPAVSFGGLPLSDSPEATALRAAVYEEFRAFCTI